MAVTVFNRNHSSLMSSCRAAVLAALTVLCLPMSAGAQPAGYMPFITDGGEKPGQIYQMDRVGMSREKVYANPDGHLHSIAFLDNDVFFVDANRTHIYRSNRCRSTIIYTHSTYVRDIAFDSHGTLFFSESSGARSDGKIFELDLATGDTRLHMTVPLSDVDGYWAGNFAFDAADTLYVSSGNRIPASIYRNDAAGLRKVYTAQNPITGFTFTGPDTLLYADHAQEIREVTAFGGETVVFRDPTATWLNDIAYGAAGDFPQQQDIDGDGEGDACDCDDSFMGENELGADCGGACGAVCDACVPVLLNGDPANNINIIFLPDKDNYTANMPVFRQNIRQVIEEAFRATPEFQNSECLFNFYYFNSTTDPADYEWNAGCVFNTPSDLYAAGNCPAGGATASAGLIAAKGEARYCSQGNNFSFGFATDAATGALLAGVKGTVRHEFGHNKIELSDEYCCDGSYWQSSAGQANVFRSQAECQAKSGNAASCVNFCPERVCTDVQPGLARWLVAGSPTPLNDCRTWAQAQGLNPADCTLEASGAVCSPNWQLFRGATNFTPHCQDGGDGWWKRDPNTCVMLSGTAFGPNCATRVNAILSGIGACGATGAGTGGPSSYASAEARQLKTLVLELSVEGGEFALQDARIIYNFPPRTFLRDAEYLLEIKGRTGETLFDMTLRDPQVQTIFSAEGGQPTKRMADTARFTAYVPFVQDMTRAVMTNRASNETVVEVDLEPVVAAFCALHQDDRACAPN